jgi:sugar phosphate isomerase/epimerase
VARFGIRGFACCNELYEHLPVLEGFRALRAIGYDAVEVAPYTFGDPVFPDALAQVPAARAAAESMGLNVVGLHWLFARTEGLHVHHPDAAVRLATRDYFLRCMDLCRELGGEILVMGSPPARAMLAGETWEEAVKRAREFFAGIMPDAEARGVVVAFEPLARHASTFINTAAEGLALMRGVGHPRFRLNLDTGALTDERRPPAETIRELAAEAPGAIAHVQVNDPNRLGPGMGALELEPIRDALAEAKYAGWLSVEAFDFTPGPEKIARESLAHLREVWGHG